MADSLRMKVAKDNSAAWSTRLRARVGLELMASANRILASASEKAPRRTGALADSGVVEQTGPLTWTVTFGRDLPDGRAIYQEYGTSHHPAQPYLGPAFQEEIPTLMGRMAMTTQGRIRIGSGDVSSAPYIVD